MTSYRDVYDECAAYLRFPTDKPCCELQVWITDQIAEASDSDNSKAGCLRRALAELDASTVCDWRTLARVAQLLAEELESRVRLLELQVSLDLVELA